MAYDPDFEVYKGKSLGSLFSDIVENSDQKRNQLDMLVGDIRSMIKTPDTAIMLVPLLKDYLDTGIKNDEQLIKLAAIVQRLISAQAAAEGESAGGFGLTDEEKRQLMAQIDTTVKTMNTPIETEKVEQLKNG